MLKICRTHLFLSFFLALPLLARGTEPLDTRTLFPKSIQLDFEGGSDSLCFSNHGFENSMGINPFGKLLGHIADSEGACQGMVGVAAAVKLKVKFRPEKKKMSGKKVEKQIKRAIRLHQNKCNGTVNIDGYENLNDLCRDHKDTLKRRSVFYNLAIARKEILKHSYTFFLRDVLDTPEKKSRHLIKHLKRFYSLLENGEFPLMLVRNHVTLVTGLETERYEDGRIKSVTLIHYDPNRILSSNADFYRRRYSFSKDGRSISGTLIWDVTPEPLTKLYCPFIKKGS